ncbi:MAG: hypothetical protein IK085_01700 [Clostridia bacterium]|nr:hypothetical protein [Clostridia bacterium]
MKTTIRIILLCTAVLSLLMLCSCLSKEKTIKKNSGLELDSEYIRYDSLNKNDELDADGYYQYSSENTVQDSENHQGEIYVTFAKNAFLEFEYYTDSKMEEKNRISSDSCYFKTGDKIYAKNSKVSNPYSNEYAFSKFIIRECTPDGEVGDKITESRLNNNLVFTIPESYAGSNLMIVPLGEFKKRKISFSAYYIDNNNRKHSLGDVKWTIGEEDPIIGNGSVEINPVSAYTVKCDYSNLADDYYYKDSSPKCFNNNDEVHIVEFRQKTSVEKSPQYNVQLHQFITIRITNSKNFFENLWSDVTGSEAIKSITVNDEERKISNYKDVELTKLREGDKVTITVNNNYLIKSKNKEMNRFIQETPIKDGYKYTITIPNTNLTEFDLYIKERG